jgi:pimeloyl-ACP methyl ester carboxylesterase
MNRISLASLFVLIVGFISPFHMAKAETMSTVCTWLTHRKPYGYCVTKTEGSTNPDLLYYMHGASLNQMSWIEKRKPIWNYWQKNHLQAPTVVTMSFGPIWLLAPKNSSKAGGLLEFVETKLMPQIEAQVGFKNGRRLLAGESMGGFNAAELIMKSPEKFTKAALLCPDFTSLTPFSTAEEMRAFMKTTGADYRHTWWEVFMERIFFGDYDAWNRSAPLLNTKRLLNGNTPALYVSGGTNDQYGFYPGDKAYAMAAREQGVSVIWDSLEGEKHCAYTPATVAKFLIENSEDQ